MPNLSRGRDDKFVRFNPHRLVCRYPGRDVNVCSTLDSEAPNGLNRITTNDIVIWSVVINDRVGVSDIGDVHRLFDHGNVLR